MTDLTPAQVFENVMEMRESADMLIALKLAFPGKTEKHKRDIEDLARVIYQYDGLIRHMLELNTRQQEMHDKLMRKLDEVLPPKDA